MDLPSFSFSKRLKSAKLHIALGGAAAVTYAAWTNSLSPDILTELAKELINDPMTILTIIQEIDPLLIVPPFAVAGGLFVTLRVTSRAGPALNRLKAVKSAGAKITSLAPQAAGSLSNSVTEQIKDKSGFFFQKNPARPSNSPRSQHRVRQKQQAAPSPQTKRMHLPTKEQQ